MAQKIVQYQAVLQLAQQAPQIYNLPLLHRQMLEVLGINNAQKLVPMHDDKKPEDPISENMNVLAMKPLKAFLYQDHEAHITAHMNFMNDPLTAKTIGQNPQAQVMAAALQAHIAEHFGFRYRQMIEQQMGAPLPYIKDEDDEHIPEEYEVQISRLVAQASVQLLQQNQANAAQQQAQQQAQDPIVQMQMQELQIKAQEVQRKAQKDQVDATMKQEEIALEREKIAAQIELESTKAGMKMSAEKDRLERQSEIEGLKMGIDIAKSKDKK
jgi:hypothetical protein